MQRLGIHVSLAISREARGEDALQIGELASAVGVGPEIVAKSNIVSPERTVCFNQMHVYTEAGPGESTAAPARRVRRGAHNRLAPSAATQPWIAVPRGTPAAMSRTGLAHIPGIEVPPTCPSLTVSVPQWSRLRCCSSSEERRPPSVVLDAAGATDSRPRVSPRFEIAGGGVRCAAEGRHPRIADDAARLGPCCRCVLQARSMSRAIAPAVSASMLRTLPRPSCVALRPAVLVAGGVHELSRNPDLRARPCNRAEQDPIDSELLPDFRKALALILERHR